MEKTQQTARRQQSRPATRQDAHREEPTKKQLLIEILVSVIGVAYSTLLLYLVYTALFYSIEYTSRIKFAIIGAVISVAECFLVYFTRRSPITSIFGMVNMALYFPLLMLEWGNWPLVIPLAIVTLFGFFCCHMNETAKTVFGTVFLLIYIIGGIAFYFITNFFFPKTEDIVIDAAVSPSGAFRYYMLDIKNNASGKYAVYVQPNNMDRDNGMFVSRCTIKKMLHQVNKPNELSCHWEDGDLYINDELYFSEAEYSVLTPTGVSYLLTESNWTYTNYDFDYPLSDSINRIWTKVKNAVTEMRESKKEEENAPAPEIEATVSIIETTEEQTEEYPEDNEEDME